MGGDDMKLLTGILVCAAMAVAAAAAQQETPKPPADDVAALKAEVARLKGMVPDQSHAMADVGFHFTNLWFAGENANWPLAQFYSDEVRSHLRWAVRIIPKRKDAENREIDLGGILGGLETSTLKDLAEAIKAKDKDKFVAAYKAQLEGCMSCHKATNKPYLRLRVPERPDAGIIEFRPE
jgi:DNA-binding GntR family transcriptional regulator